MNLLSDEVLLDAYFKAIQLKLEKDFILLLYSEIQRRNLPEIQEPRFLIV
ncbi:sporulation histidine kinase inhibitor Sda [Aneurinibacillus sp. Ricciae_BoGa-3]|nr:sporulation histidine kinase inhibitor Sda [Aneurinibacillus sp. Ricciae_BoGa-3]WCK52915.1 sporulation histidine kinase inhibitor Sda [Aneurinibacillus sp. Ricciae_BoGa-3]